MTRDRAEQTLITMGHGAHLDVLRIQMNHIYASASASMTDRTYMTECTGDAIWETAVGILGEDMVDTDTFEEMCDMLGDATQYPYDRALQIVYNTMGKDEYYEWIDANKDTSTEDMMGYTASTILQIHDMIGTVDDDIVAWASEWA